MGARPQHRPAYRRLCKLLRRWRTDAGLTQRELAAKLRKPHSYIPKVESGERRVDPLEFAAWCRACGIRPEQAIIEIDRG